MARIGPPRVGWLAGLVALGLFFHFVPLFRIVSLDAAREQSAAAVFDPVAYVADFWTGPLNAAARNAVDAAELIAALKLDYGAAVARYGHRLGLGATSSYFVSGEGRITAVYADAIVIAPGDETVPGEPIVVRIGLGPVFGNAIRDGSGLLDVSDFANAQDFNALSAEINRRVETQVLPSLASSAEVGKTVRFAGGVELSDAGSAPAILEVVPYRIEFP